MEEENICEQERPEQMAAGDVDPCEADANDLCVAIRDSVQRRIDQASLSGRLTLITCDDDAQCAVEMFWPDYILASREYMDFLGALGCESSVELPQPSDVCDPVSVTASADCTDGAGFGP